MDIRRQRSTTVIYDQNSDKKKLVPVDLAFGAEARAAEINSCVGFLPPIFPVREDDDAEGAINSVS